jgi:hypothetical protein
MIRLRLLALACLLVGLLPANSSAGIFLSLNDREDDEKAVGEIRDAPQARGFRQAVETFRKRLLQWKERDFRALFGNPAGRVQGRYAMPSTEARVLGLSGIRYADPNLNKDHTDTHLIGPAARMDVYYPIDGETPVHVQFYLKVDKEFVKFTRAADLGKRLEWERPRFRQLVKQVEQRWREVVAWEVDGEKQKAQYAGMNSGDFAGKLQGVLNWGKRQGYRLDHRPADGARTPRWTWYDGKKVIAEAYHDRGFKGVEGKPSYFIFYRADGTRLRDEGGWPSLGMIRWYRPDGSMVRLEQGTLRDGSWRPTSWCWYGKKGEGVRTEWDTNGDGIPDTYRIGAFHERDPGRPLAAEQSWAVHPDLIPAELGIPGQSDRRVPLRRIKE